MGLSSFKILANRCLWLFHGVAPPPKETNNKWLHVCSFAIPPSSGSCRKFGKGFYYLTCHVLFLFVSWYLIFTLFSSVRAIFNFLIRRSFFSTLSISSVSMCSFEGMWREFWDGVYFVKTHTLKKSLWCDPKS